MNFEEGQNLETQKHKIENESDEELQQRTVDVFNNSTAEDIIKILKQDPESIAKNISEINEELDDLQKRINNMESTLKSPTKNVDDKGATTQENVNKLSQRRDEISNDKQKMQLREPMEKHVRAGANFDISGKEQEIAEMRDEIDRLDKRIADSQNYQSKGEFGANDVAVGKEDVAIKKRDALKNDVQRLEKLIKESKKAQEVIKNIDSEKQNNKKETVEVVEDTEDEKKVESEKGKEGGLESQSTEELQKAVQELWKKRGEILTAKKSDSREFQDVERQLHEVQDILKERGEEYKALVLENMVFGADEDEADKLEKESNRRKEVGENNVGGPRYEVGVRSESKESEKESSQRKETNVDTEKLLADLSDARRGYTKLHYKNEGMMKKISALFSRSESQKDVDLENAKGEYQKALESYRNGLLEKFDSLSGEQQKEALLELKKFDLNEGINLYEDRVAARAESRGGKLGEYAVKAVNQYKKLPTKWKIALSGALLVGGMATGTGVAAGVFGAATIGKRALGAGVAGVGATGWAEARAQKKESEGIENSLEDFKKLSLEEQKALLTGFDNQSFQELEKTFQGKVSGRKKRVMLGLGAAAGIMTVGYAGKVFAATEGALPDSDEVMNREPHGRNFAHLEREVEEVVPEGGLDDYSFETVTGISGQFTENMMQTDAFEEFKNKFGPEAHAKYIAEHGNSEEVELAWQRGVRTAADRYETLARAELQAGGIPEFNTPEDTSITAEIDENALELSGDNHVFDSRVARWNENMKGTEAFARFQARYGEAAYQKFLEEDKDIVVNGELIDTLDEKRDYWNKQVSRAIKHVESDIRDELQINMAMQIAEERGIANSDGTVKFNLGRSLNPEINGITVPEEEIERIRAAGRGESDMIINPDNATIPESEMGGEQISGVFEGNQTYDSFMNDLSDAERNSEAFKGFQETFGEEEYQRFMNSSGSIEYGGEKLDTPEKLNARWQEMVREGIEDFNQKITIELGAIEVPEVVVPAESAVEAFKGVSIFVGEGSSVQGALIQFLESGAENMRLAEVMSGWKDASVSDLAKRALTLDHDSQEYRDAIHRLAEIRASVLSNEFAESHPGIDLDTVKSDTRLILDVDNREDMKLDIDFKDGPRIVPEQAKKIVESAAETVVKTGEVALEKFDTKEEIIAAFGMNEEQYDFIQKQPAESYINDLKGMNPDASGALSEFDKYLLDNVAGRDDIDLKGKNIGDVLGIEKITILDQEPVLPGAENIVEQVPVAEEVVQSVDVEASAQERIAAMKELAGNPAFKEMIGTQMQEVFGGSDPVNTMRNVGNAKMEFFQGVGTQGKNLAVLQGRAVEALGESGNPKPNEKVGKYFFRIAANAAREGKIQDVFPSSEFTA